MRRAHVICEAQFTNMDLCVWCKADGLCDRVTVCYFVCACYMRESEKQKERFWREKDKDL